MSEFGDGGDDASDEAVFLGFLGVHPEVSVGVAFDFFDGLAGFVGDESVAFGAEFEDFGGFDLDVGGIAADAGGGLVDEEAGVGEAVAAVFG